MKDQGFTVRRMTRQELDLAVEWAAAEGWNPGIHDADAFYAADPNGFFLGVLNGEPIGSMSAVAYDGAFGFLGFYIVRPDFRGRGYGIRIWRKAMAYMGDRTMGGDAVIQQLDNYAKEGFKPYFHSVRYEGVGGGVAPKGLVDLSIAPFDELCAYDRPLFPAPRKQFLKIWIRQPEGAALGAIRDGRLAGYGVLRACRSGFKIGPLFADHERIAEALFCGLVARAPGAPVFLDAPQVNPTAVALAQRHGMKPVFETARICNKRPPDLPMHRIFGVTSFELG